LKLETAALEPRPPGAERLRDGQSIARGFGTE
jgi:hypothetical protein